MPTRDTFNLVLFFVGVLTEGNMEPLLRGWYYGPWEMARGVLTNLLWR